MNPKALRRTGTDAEVVGCLWILQSLPDVCQGGPGTMLPIWKQILLGLCNLMDGEIFLGCPAEPADSDPINHPSPVPTEGEPTSTKTHSDPPSSGVSARSPEGHRGMDVQGKRGQEEGEENLNKFESFSLSSAIGQS
ncbi:Cell surface Cu-only superoxide dismutase 5 [Dissostichus eleginoides]|uniref:Cell surface Cu-only superoxide dismutase 5 n=1 Tax=Dissostichus eleginoides TaxID=100907 RepID=A0AAD9ETS8_DISEL|nr:Cell surface Cu-only superoxide dismutase 5 [Dissostichus eleginoides]